MVPLFLGSPACCYLTAVVSHLAYTVIFLAFESESSAAVGGLTACLIATCVSLLSYGVALHANELYETIKCCRYVCQAVVAGLLLGLPTIYGITRTWEPWGYFVAVWMIALVVIILHDFLFMGLHVKHFPVWRFTERIGRPIDQREETM